MGGEIGWLSVVQRFENKKTSLENHSLFNRKPVESFQVWRDMRETGSASYYSAKSILNALKSAKFRLSDVMEKSIAVVQTTADEGIG